jgi:hypothetical protein
LFLAQLQANFLPWNDQCGEIYAKEALPILLLHFECFACFKCLYLCFFSTYNKDKYMKRIAILHSIARSSLVFWKCLANFGLQILGKALQFPGKRLQISLPECLVTLDTDFDWLRQKNKPFREIFLNIEHGARTLKCIV